jgi:hypothetical protein
LTKIIPRASFQVLVNVLCNSKVEARLSRVDESEEREGFDEDSVERERPPKLVRESSVTNELVAVAKSAGLSLK